MLKLIYRIQKYKRRAISINGKKFNAIIADTFAKRMIGLMFRKSIKENECMLFIFGNEAYQSIWMYHMEFPIDILWTDSNYKIVDIKEGFEPCNSLFNCKEYNPKSAAKYIIELNKGTIKKNRINFKSKISL